MESAPVPAACAESLRRAAAAFLGDSMQVPPMYSALKHGGERLYRLARAGVKVDRAPRPVRIHRLELLDAGENSPEFEVRCSKGTYVRSLAEDIARALGTVGHVVALRRTALGPFDGCPVHALDALENAAAGPGGLDALLVPLDRALPGFPAVQLGAVEHDSILQGRPVAAAGPCGAQVRIYGVEGCFLGVGRMSAEGLRLAPERLMVALPETTAPRA